MNQKADEEGVEGTVEERELRRQLQQFFQQHLPTVMQQRVAEAIFLEGLEPKEIAALMGKPPHEVRLLKARVVQKLKQLNDADKQRLLEILGEEKR